MKKFKFLVKYGLKKRVGRKAFLIANIVIALLMIIIVNIPAIISFFGGDDDLVENINIHVVNETQETNLVSDLSQLFNQPFEGYEFYVLSDLAVNQFDVEAFWVNSEVDITFHFTGDIESPDVKIYSKYPEMNPALMGQIELQIINYQIGDYTGPSFETIYAPDYEDPNQEMFISSITSLLVLPMFILITMATQFVGVDIIEEKSTKAIETVIASVPAKIHFLSKITASILFVIIQGLLIFTYGAIASLIGGVAAASPGLNLPTGGESLLAYLAEMMPNWPIIILFSLMFMLLGTLFYLVLAALFASMAVTQEDYQQFQSPLMLILVGGFYIGIFAPMAGGMGFLKVMAFIPIFTPIVAPIAFASGVLSIWESIIALLGLAVFLVLSLYMVAPVYKVAILSYDQTKFFSRIKGYFKKAFTKSKKV
ncbi:MULTISPECIES: ABC transporter permease [Bacteria]|uniref:ABC transporter permease n=2 Tax=cellular organisms TaxID=131567 RepID=A0ABT5XI85_9EURY|nr:MULTISPECIES: ABC transporter permease [Bacteria]MDF0594351.1 ABC transporter permease [Candidatus Methanocrinis alkalitolerans]MDI6452258.1 ABC transporter permease [Mariniplasma sp. M4Ah]MDR4968501.1 ABC transporter permease [Acholeplasmataceae bacterium]